MILVPSLEQEWQKALDHDRIIIEQILNLLQWDVIRMVGWAEALANKVVSGVETCLLNEEREVCWLQIEFFYGFDCALHILEWYKDVDEQFLKFRVTLDKAPSSVQTIWFID